MNTAVVACETIRSELERAIRDTGSNCTLMILDSGTDPIEPLIESAKVIAETLHLDQKVAPATRDYLEELLSGPWSDERFVVLAPGSIITARDLMLPAT